LKPDFGQAYNNRGLVYQSLSDYDKAIEDGDKAILLQPDFALAYYFRGVGYYSQLELDKAIADFQIVLELNNDPALQQEARVLLTELGVK